MAMAPATTEATTTIMMSVVLPRPPAPLSLSSVSCVSCAAAASSVALDVGANETVLVKVTLSTVDDETDEGTETEDGVDTTELGVEITLDEDVDSNVDEDSVSEVEDGPLSASESPLFMLSSRPPPELVDEDAEG